MIPVRGFDGDKVAVFGLGRTGLSAARGLAAGGARPVLWDDKAANRDQAAAEGFELLDLTTADWTQLAALISLHKAHRNLLHGGRLTRLIHPDANCLALMVANEASALVSAAQVETPATSVLAHLRVPGLKSADRFDVRMISKAPRSARWIPPLLKGQTLRLSGAALALPAVWTVRDADSELVLFGSIHALPTDLAWRPPALDAALARARMALLSATAQVLRNALAMLGVSAPESMNREAPAGAEVDA